MSLFNRANTIIEKSPIQLSFNRNEVRCRKNSVLFWDQNFLVLNITLNGRKEVIDIVQLQM
jgi:hypothetical protein